MTLDEYKTLPLRDRVLIDFLTDLKREIRRMADALEHLAEEDEA